MKKNFSAHDFDCVAADANVYHAVIIAKGARARPGIAIH